MMNSIAAARRYWFLKLILFFAALALADFICQVGIGETAKALPSLRGPIWLAGGVLLAAIMIFVYRRLVSLFEERPAAELEPRRVAGPGLAGLPLGVLLFALTMGLLGLADVAHFARSEALPNFLRLLGGSLSAAAGEEILFRGVLFRIVEQRFGSLVGVAVSAILFGAAHAANPGAGLTGVAAIALEAGVLLSAAYLASRSLWLPIWLHFGWNFTEGAVFGTAVSGRTPPGLIATTLSGPDLLTGGAFGPEASIVALGVASIASLGLLTIAVRRGHWLRARYRA